jgi:hypothetical protein
VVESASVFALQRDHEDSIQAFNLDMYSIGTQAGCTIKYHIRTICPFLDTTCLPFHC